MPVFQVEQYELHSIAYRIEAENAVDAIVRILDGEAEPVEGSSCFVELADDRGILVEEHPRLAVELKAAGVPVDDRIIPSIRSVSLVGHEVDTSFRLRD